jgi:hypothetical protein
MSSVIDLAASRSNYEPRGAGQAADRKQRRTCRPEQFLVIGLLCFCSPNVFSAEQISVRINNQLISAYRTSDLETAKQVAAAGHKPIAWIASSPKLLDGNGNISLANSRGATLHAFFSLRERAVLVFMDAYEENHKCPDFIDYALHHPDVHYTPPTVLFLDSAATNVLATVTFEPDFVKRAKALAKALDDVKGKF